LNCGEARTRLARERPGEVRRWLDQRGWLFGAAQIRSPNYDARTGATVDLLVIHAISLPPGEFGGNAITQLFTNRLDATQHSFFAEIQHLRVSAHFLIRRCGQIMQFVSVYDRAWHAGESQFDGRRACNDFSIGIELEGSDVTAFEDAQYLSLSELSQILITAFPHITAQRIAGHSAIAPGRKTDPGPFFDWQRLLGELDHQG
jgi:N-acetyl-anhydromuramoyl-L-alanine amidase